MGKPLLHSSAVVAALLLCTTLPFLPGRHDPLAASVSWLARVLGLLASGLVPIGASWLVHRRWRRARGVPPAQGELGFARAAWMTLALVALLLSIAAVARSGPTLGGGLALLAAGALGRSTPRRLATSVRPTALPFHLIVVPLAVAPLQAALVERATAFARGRAIDGAAPLIAAIERHRTGNGRYPPSLLALNSDHPTGVVGIADYRYEPSGEAYQLLFEAPTLALDAREVVVYHPHDRAVATSHALDLLDVAPEHLDRVRGHYATRDAGRPGWRSFLYD